MCYNEIIIYLRQDAPNGACICDLFRATNRLLLWSNSAYASGANTET
jgi:hypothetical protein